MLFALYGASIETPKPSDSVYRVLVLVSGRGRQRCLLAAGEWPVAANRPAVAFGGGGRTAGSSQPGPAEGWRTASGGRPATAAGQLAAPAASRAAVRLAMSLTKAG